MAHNLEIQSKLVVWHRFIKAPIPAFGSIMSEYEKDDPAHNLRVGQWFFNKFIRQSTSTTYNLDLLYNSTDHKVIFDILGQMYRDYQWP